MTRPSTTSLWMDTAPDAPPRPADGIADTHSDVVVVGAGIVGCTAALLLTRQGLRVTVLEARTVGSGVTGSTTGKVTAAHGLRYSRLRGAHGEERTRWYAAANQAAVDWIRETVESERIDCQWRDVTAWTYTSNPKRVRQLEQEARATIEAGLPATAVASGDAPTSVLAGVKVTGGGEMDARAYCLGLARAAEAGGATFAEGVRVTAVREGSPMRVRTAEHGELTGDHVIVATHVPILDRGLYFARLEPERSYAIAVGTDVPVPADSFYDVGPPARSVRTAVGPDGEPLVIVGGESHPTGRGGSTADRYARLEDWARERLNTTDVRYRWSAQDPTTPDLAPYVGPLRVGSSRLWTATGFGKWGLSGGTAAALALSERILGREDPYAGLWNPARVIQVRPRGLVKLAQLNLHAGLSLVLDRLRRPGDHIDSLGPGEGRILRHEGQRTAAFRDEHQMLHRFSPTCTHLGCEVCFNDAEQSWDCPCHGSRFDARDGTVLEGPAVRPLARRPAKVPPHG